MASFSYQVLNDAGRTISGTLEADSVDQARQKLMALGYIPISVRGGKAKGGFERWLDDFQTNTTSVTLKDLILFTKQFRTMVQAGLSILELLRILEEQTENRKLKRVCGEMGAEIKKGKTLSEAFAAHPKVFPDLYRHMISAGEQSGSLPEVLDRLIYLIVHEHKVKSDIRSALQYPITVLIALALAFYVLLTFVIPKFIVTFRKANLELPTPTVIAIGMYEFFDAYGYYLLAAVIGGLFLFARFLKTRKGRLWWDGLWLRVPIFGPLFTKAAMARFSSIFAILQSSGLSVLAVLDILENTIGNAAIALEFSKIKEMLKEGRGLSGPLRQAKFFTPMVINMVAVGEETGNLVEMLMAVSEHYDSEVEYAVSSLSEAINPILIVGLAGIIGFFAMAIFLPMWDLTKMVKT